MQKIYQKIFDLCPDMFCVASFEGYFLHLNESWSRVFGFSNSYLQSKPFVEFIHPDDVTKTIEETKSLAQGSHVTIFFENRYRKIDGSYLWLAWSAQTDGNKIYAYAKDMTAVKKNEAFLSEIQSHAKIGGWSYSLQKQQIYMTDETRKIYGLLPGQVPSIEESIEYYHPDDRGKIIHHFTACLEEKTPYDDIYKFITRSGRNIWVRSTGHPIIDNQGNVAELIGTFQDVTNFINLSQELDATSKQLYDIANNSPGMVYQFQASTDGSFKFNYVSPNGSKIFDISSEKLQSKSDELMQMIHPEDLPSMWEQTSDCVQHLQPYEWSGRVISGIGKIKWIKIKSSIPHKDDSGNVIFNGLVMDITKEKELEQKLIEQRRIAEHSARLATIGELAAGVGHEINNPLTIVIGNFLQLKKEIDRLPHVPPKIATIIKRQQDACSRIAKIVGGLKTLAYGGEAEKDSICDIGECINGTVDLIEDIYKKDGIEIKKDMRNGKFPAHFSSTESQQIIMNLISNARDASIETECPQITISVADNLQFWRLSVSDNGTGIPLENQDKLFDAFYTTKQVGKGTGLGLSICRSIIEAGGGKIAVESRPGHTVFHVDFPKNKPPEAISLDENHARNLTVLVVDDERGIRDLLEDYFEDHGCTVFTAPDGNSAIKIVKEQSLDLILSDFTMPGMTGFDFFAQVEKQNLAPDAAKFIVTGGMALDQLADKGNSYLNITDGIITKPFEDLDLEKTLQTAIAKKSALKQSA